MKTLLLGLLLLLATATARAESAPSATDAKKNDTGKARTLDTIQIEGEVDMPQVLFITARERYRTMDHLHRRYLKSCSQLGREARIAKRVTRSPSDSNGNLSKEN